MAVLDIPFRRWKSHPRVGIDFPDSAPVATDAETCAAVVDALAGHLAPDIELVVGIDMGGYGFAGAVAYKRRIGFVDARKVSNISPELMRTLTANYVTGDGLAISKANRLAGRKVAVLDDCLLSGSTARAAIRLLRELGADCTAALFIYAIEGLGGRGLLENDGVSVHVLKYLPPTGDDDAAGVAAR